MSPLVIAMTGMLVLGDTPCDILHDASTDSIRVEYSGQADLTNDGVPEKIVASATGLAWNNLLVRLEFRNTTGDLLYADEWSSKDWCGGYSFHETREVSVEEWVRNELNQLVDPEYFLPTGEYCRNGDLLRNHKEVGYGVRADLYEQLWRAKNDIPIHEHLCQQTNMSDIYTEFRGQVSDEQVETLVDEVVGDSGYVYSPHFDGLYIVAWIPSKQRFAIVIWGG